MSEKISKNSERIRGDEVVVNEQTGAISSDYLGAARHVLQELNKVSKSMCLAKWYNTSINLTTGHTQSCYHPAPTLIPKEEILKEPSALHNTPHKKIQRQKMLHGERPYECQYCWNIEDSGDGTHLSDRAYRSADFYSKELLVEAVKLGAEGNPNPRVAEITFTNKCNLKCSYCSPHQSSAWYDEVDKRGSFRLDEHNHNDIRGLAGLGLLPPKEQTQKYVDSFWEWWPKMYKDLKHFKISGGEPLLDENTYKIFDYVLANPKKELQLMLISNCNPPAENWNKFLSQIVHMAKAESFDHFMLFFSLDAWGTQAEYIRRGLNFTEAHRNIEEFLQKTEKTSVTIVSTFNALSVVGLKKFLEGALELRKKYSNDRQKIWIDLPQLNSPEWLSTKILPKEYSVYVQEAIDFVEANQETVSNRFKGFKDFELEKIKTLHASIAGNQLTEKTFKSRRDFIKFFDEQDRRENQSSGTVFPEMKKFLDQCSALVAQNQRGG